MVDPQHVVSGIRNLLYSGQQPPLDVLMALAGDYAEACHAVNQRLGRCEEFLRQGMRAEAVHYAQTEPNVLDALTVLDFAERPHWTQLLIACNVPVPPVFRVETATALNRAYAEVQPLEHLLRQHRLLALTRAPLGERIAVLHQLAQADPHNAIWQQDISTFENVRVQHLQREVEELQRQPHMPEFEEVQRLVMEVQGWRTGLPPGLAATLQHMHSLVSDAYWKKQLGELARGMAAAYKAKDEAAARSLVHQWGEIRLTVPLPHGDKRSQAYATILRWLEKLDREHSKQDEHQQALDELDTAINRHRDLGEEELEELYDQAAAFKGGVPLPLENSYKRRIKQIQDAKQKRERLLMMGVVGLIGVASLSLFLFLVLR